MKYVFRLLRLYLEADWLKSQDYLLPIGWTAMFAKPRIWTFFNHLVLYLANDIVVILRGLRRFGGWVFLRLFINRPFWLTAWKIQNTFQSQMQSVECWIFGRTLYFLFSINFSRMFFYISRRHPCGFILRFIPISLWMHTVFSSSNLCCRWRHAQNRPAFLQTIFLVSTWKLNNCLLGVLPLHRQPNARKFQSNEAHKRVCNWGR